ncbi:CARDB domain-containing protein [Hymenobacter busanensis]|nr:CARDB domain-containing protein [Hymenobacter busanensis]
MVSAGLAKQAHGQAYIMPVTGASTITTCAGNLYDNGGPAGPYAPNSNSTTTILPGTAGNKVKLQFNSFVVDYNDYLTIYDGTSTAAPIIGTYYGANMPGTVYGSTSSGALTLRFGGYNYYSYSGFDASISCVTSVPQPDLTLQGATAYPASVVAGGTIQSSCSIYNLSGTTATSSNVGYYLSTNATLDAGDQLLGTSIGGALSVNGSSFRNSYLQLGTAVAPGSYFLLFVADYQNAVSESNEQNNVSSVSITVASPNHDLVIQQASALPVSVAQGGILSLSCYINNLGNATAPSSSVGYYLSTNATLDASDVLLTSTFGGTLVPAFQSSRYGTTNIPAGTPTGSYYVLFVADYQNVVGETNEQNNVAAVSITVSPPGIDLLFQQASLYYTTVTAGTANSTSAYLVNQGNITAGASSVGYYLSTNTTLDAGDVLLVSSAVGSLGAGQSTAVYGNFTVPAATAPGSYYVLFVADRQGQVTETNEQNNVVSVPMTVQQPNVDLVIQQPGLSVTTAAPGFTFYANNYIANIGTTLAASSNVGYYLSTNTTLDANDVLLTSTFGGTLSGGTSSSRFGSLTVPVGTATGSYYVLFVADYQNQVGETNEQNNVASVPFTVAPASPDYVVSQAFVSRSATAAGGTVTCSAYFSNQGSALAPANSLRIYLSTNTTLDVNDVLLSNVPTAAISPGFGQTYNTNVVIPNTTTPAGYYVLFVADAQNAVPESNEQNNLAYSVMNVTAPFNGQMVPQTGTSTITTCSTTVYDNGGTDEYANFSDGTLTILPATAGAKVRLNFTSFALESGFDYLYIYDGNSTAATLLGSFTGFQSPGIITASNGNSSGALTLRFTSDQTAVAPGFEAAVSCFTAALPDLTLPQFTATPTTVAAGAQVAASVTLSNVGPGVAAATVVSYYLSQNAVFDAGDQLLGTSSGGTLNNGASVTRNNNVTVPTNVASGTYYLLAIADPSGAVVETNEQNNAAAPIAITVIGANPDLVVSSPTVSPVSVSAGANVATTCFFENSGPVAAGAHGLGYYLSTDATFSSNDVWLHSINVASMNPGFGSTRTAAMTIPANTVPGPYFLLYVADPAGQVTETNEQNNVVSRAITVLQGTAVREQTAGFAISLFPSPVAAGAAFTVEVAGAGQTTAAELTLVNSLGQVVSRRHATLRSTGGSQVFGTETLARGVYTLRISGANLNVVRRVVID